MMHEANNTDKLPRSYILRYAHFVNVYRRVYIAASLIKFVVCFSFNLLLTNGNISFIHYEIEKKASSYAYKK